jgi:type III restriction enzyme
MVVTVGAINKKDVNNLYKDSEKTGGERPIDLIKATRPIVIVDEPQSVDGGLEGRGKEALGAMNPLCTLRYSATHVDKHHMVYRLDALDAYQKRLVKQISRSRSPQARWKMRTTSRTCAWSPFRTSAA